MVMVGQNKYTDMQKNEYAILARTWDIDRNGPIGAPIDKLNNWIDFEYMFDGIPDLENRECLDFGCGPGRNLLKYYNRFKLIDGVDLDEYNIFCAKRYLSANKLNVDNFRFYVNSGYDIECINDEQYDLIISTICLQHICVYDIRFSLLCEFFRILRHNGYIAIQMGYGVPSPRTVGYYDNYYDATKTNRSCDTSISNVKEIENDLIKIGFTNFRYHIKQPGPGDFHPNWIYFNAMKE